MGNLFMTGAATGVIVTLMVPDPDRKKIRIDLRKISGIIGLRRSRGARSGQNIQSKDFAGKILHSGELRR
jgi:hypothetical protein